MHTINIVIVPMDPVSSGNEEWIHVFCAIHLAKRGKLYRARSLYA